MKRRRVYLDYAATSPVDPRVAADMARCLTIAGAFANPSSTHAFGHEAKHLCDDARRIIAATIGGDVAGVVFTSGATEANNLALTGVIARAPAARRHIVTTLIEHKSVLDTVRALENLGCRATYVGCDRQGRVAPEDVVAALRDDTALCAVMHVNNETGTVQDITTIATACRERGVLLHVDAAQSVGKVQLDIAAAGIDLCALTAHKAYGPKGIGVLHVRPGVRISPLMHGGEQQRGLRPGTLPTHQIVGMATAFGLAGGGEERSRLAALRARLWRALETIDGARVNGDFERGAPHILNVSFPGVDGESLRCALRDIAVSAGSACTADSPDASHVLSSMGLGDAAALSALRFSFGRFTTGDEVDYVAMRVVDEVARLRRIGRGAPPWCWQ